MPTKRSKDTSSKRKDKKVITTLSRVLELTSQCNKGIFLPEPNKEERYLPYLTLYEKAERTLFGLQQQKLQAGDAVILQIDDLLDYCINFWACILGGIQPVTIAIPPIYDADNAIFKKILSTNETLKAKAIVCSCNITPSIKSLMSDTKIIDISRLETHKKGTIHIGKIDDIAFYQLSSGSTGIPKVIPETHYAVIQHAHVTSEFNHYGDDEIFLNWLPMDHVVPLLMNHLLSIVMQYDQVMMRPEHVIQDPLYWLTAIDTYQATRTWAPNFAFKLVTDKMKKSPPDKLSLASIKSFINAGEQVTASVMQEFITTFTPYALQKNVMWIMYGMAELATAITCEYFQDDTSIKKLASSNNQTFVRVGGIYPNFSVRIVDDNDNVLTGQAVGRVQVQGDTIMPGYINNPVANNEAFTKDGWFNTGDLGFVENNILTITGREKELMIVNGVNIYPYEIEDVINQMPEIEATYVACTAVRSPNSHTDEVAIFYVAKNRFSDLFLKIRATIAERCGIHVSYIIALSKQEFPKTTSGKIQRNLLKQNFEASNNFSNEPIQTKTTQCSEATESETIIIGIWKKLFNIESLDSTAHFFQLGGDSILAIQMLYQVCDQCNAQLTFTHLYQFPTIQALAAEADKTKGNTQKINQATTAQASFGQQRFRILQFQLGKDNSAYYQTVRLSITGDLDVVRLQECLAEIYNRHSVLRTRFADDLKDQSIIFLNKKEFSFTHIKDNIDYLAPQFDLNKGPLFKVVLIEQGARQYILQLNFHHAIIDGWSVAILFNELSALYNGDKSQLPTLPIQYHDYSAWHKTLSFDEAHIKNELKSLQPCVLPYAPDRDASASGQSDYININFHHLYQPLKDLATSLNTTLFTVLSCGIHITLSKLTRQKSVFFATTLNNRNHAEVQDLIGYFIEPIIIHSTIAEGESVESLINKTHKSMMKLVAQQNIPFDKLVEIARLEENESLDDFMMFQLIKTFQPPSLKPLKAVVLPDTHQPCSRFNFGMQLYESDKKSELYGHIEFNKGLYSKNFASEFATLLAQTLAFMTQQPSSCLIGNQKIIDNTWNAHDVLYPDWKSFATPYQSFQLLHELFENQVKLTPKNTALMFQEKCIDYQTLNVKANQLAHYLCHVEKIKLGDRIGVCLGRSPELIISILAILKCGAVFVPLETGLSDKTTIDRKLIHADVSHVIVGPFSQLTIDKSKNYVRILIDEIAFEDYKSDNLELSISAQDPIYIMYTSGTTGVPKGVVCSHAGLFNWALVQKYLMGIEETDRIFLCAPITFDASYWEIFMALCHGAALVLNPNDERIKPSSLKKLFKKAQVSVATFTPSMLSLFEPEALPHLRNITLTGEACDKKLVSQWQAAGKDIFNGYGPTEACIGATLYKLDPDSSISIGLPIPNKIIHLLDEDQNVLLEQGVGEIVIGGLIADGYWRDEKLTQEKFVTINILDQSHRVYFTGDLGRRREDGTIEFVARIDRQVKVQGIRIELQAIEQALKAQPEIRRAAVVDVGEGANKYLTAFIVYEGPLELSEHALADVIQAKTSLAECALPKKYIALPALPQDKNSKVDLKRLKKMAKLHKYDGLNTIIADPGSIEESIINIWRDTLCKREDELLGITDNFIKLGGTSLLSAQMLTKIESHFDTNITWQDFFGTHLERSEPHHGTAKWLATLIQQNNLTVTEQCEHIIHQDNISLVSHKPGNSPAIVFLPGLTGKNHYHELVKQLQILELDNAVYTIEFNQMTLPLHTQSQIESLTEYTSLRMLSRRLDINLQKHHIPSIESLVKNIVDVIEISPLDNICLAGWSFGGLIAELIRQHLVTIDMSKINIAQIIAIDTDLKELPMHSNIKGWLQRIIHHIHLICANHQVKVRYKGQGNKLFDLSYDNLLDDTHWHDLINNDDHFSLDYQFALDQLFQYHCVFKQPSTDTSKAIHFISELFTLWECLRTLCHHEMDMVSGEVNLISCDGSHLGWSQFVSHERINLRAIESQHSRLLHHDAHNLAHALKSVL